MLTPTQKRGALSFTALLPLVVFIFGSIVAVEHYEPTQWQAEQEAKNQSEAKTVDILGSERVAYYTKILAIFTGVLSGFGLLQIAFLIRADHATAKGLIAAARQAEIANRQYIASNRPKLRVRDVRIDRPVEGNLIVARFEVVNVGGTSARIIDTTVTIRITAMPLAGRLYGQGYGPEVVATRQIPFAHELKQGEALPASGGILQFERSWGFDAGSWWNNRLYVIGEIRYMDDNSVVRRTAFYRIATEDLNRFEFPKFSPAQIADFEFED